MVWWHRATSNNIVRSENSWVWAETYFVLFLWVSIFGVTSDQRWRPCFHIKYRTSSDIPIVSHDFVREVRVAEVPFELKQTHLNALMILAIRHCVAWASMLNIQHSERRKSTENLFIYIWKMSSYPFCTCFRLELGLFLFSSWIYLVPQASTISRALYNSCKTHVYSSARNDLQHLVMFGNPSLLSCLY